MLRRTRDTKLLQVFVDERYNALYIARRTIVSLANCCSASCNRVLSTSSKQAFSLLSKNSWRSRKVASAGEGNVCKATPIGNYVSGQPPASFFGEC